MYTEKIRIYPNKEQQKLIEAILWECKEFYNYLLEVDREYYDLWKTSPKSGRLKFYESLRKQFNFKYTPAQVQQQVSKRLERSYENFFNPKHFAYHKKIKFKSLAKFRSMTFPQVAVYGSGRRSYGIVIYLKENILKFTNIGKIKAKFTRSISGIPKTVTIKKMKAGEYYAFITIDGPSPKKKELPFPPNSVVGIDLGVEKFLVTSDGKMISRPRFTNRHERNRIKRAQRKLSRSQKGSKNREKQRIKLAKLHERVVNQRRDHHFKVAHWLCSNYQCIVAENLDVQSMIRKNNRKGKLFRKLLSSVALGEFLVILAHMTNKYQRQYIGVDPNMTSQVCSKCGSVVPKTLNDRNHICPSCGLSVDRDLNAAWNILSLGLTGSFGSWIQHGTVGTTETITLEKIIVPGVC